MRRPRARPAKRSCEVVRRGFEVETKRDSSPVTEADRAAELIILAALARAAPGVPVIAEEEVAAGRIPAHDDTYFLVDPLDGTKEFVRGGDDYTVNIGLIEGGQPKLGVVFAPATGRLHGGLVGDGAWLEEGSGRRPIRRAPGAASRDRGRVEVALQPGDRRLSRAGRRPVRLCRGRLVASNSASSRKARPTSIRALSPTSEWDTAAGHAVLLAAGGLVDGPDGEPLAYGKRAFLNRAFVATSGWKPPLLGAIPRAVRGRRRPAPRRLGASGCRRRPDR